MEILAEIKGFMRICRIAAELTALLPRFQDANYIVNIGEPMLTIQVVIEEGHEVGLPQQRKEWLLLDKKVTVVSDGGGAQPIKGCWMLHHNFHEETETFFYWHTKLVTVHYDQQPYRREISDATPKAS